MSQKIILQEIPLREACKTSFTKADVLRKLGLSVDIKHYQKLDMYIQLYGIDISHFTLKYNYEKLKERNHGRCRSILIDDETKYNVSGSRLLNALLRYEKRKYKCEICGINTWNGKELKLQVHHIDGIKHHNNPGNLLILCPNCHSQTDNFCGRGIKNRKEPRLCSSCGKVLLSNNKTGLCRECYKEVCDKNHVSTNGKPYKHPKELTRDILIEEIQNNSFVALGLKYNVSDNTIRKWCKKYNIDMKLYHKGSHHKVKKT